MRLRHPFTALCVAITSLFAVAGVAQASPITVNVRIEGAKETLFEGPVAVEPHGVKASSDSSSKLRSCDGINSLDPWNTVPAPTSTSSSVDAMSLIGESFDGKWYPGFNDYFITRFGPDREIEGKSWGILVNNTFTNVGGCQYQLDEGDEVLWIFNAFNNRKNLALLPAGSTSGTRPLTAEVAPGTPFQVEVRDYEDNLEDNPPAHPELTGSAPFAGAYVSPVATNANGFQRVETSSPETAPLTGANGLTSIEFTTPGWHRIKATVPGAIGREEEVFRSNRIDVCVEGGPGPALEGATECDQLPLADQVRVPPPTLGETEEPGESSRGGNGGGGTNGGSTGGGSTPPPAAAPAPAPQPPAPLQVSVPTLDRKELSEGKVTVSWKVIDAGAGVKGWTISSQTVGAKKARWVKRASGTTKTSAKLRLPRGHAYRLRFTITDATGKSSNVTIGKVRVPKARATHARNR
jgi:hypothetical protein